MRELTTREAKLGSTFAGHIVEHAAHILSLAAEFALHVRTPLDVFVFVSERLAEPLPVGLFVFWRAC